MITVSMHDLVELSALAFAAGKQDYANDIDPTQDRMKQNEAKRFLKSRGYKPVMLRKWTDAGLLHPVKTGETQNCPTVYSKAELRKVLHTVKLKIICNNP